MMLITNPFLTNKRLYLEISMFLREIFPNIGVYLEISLFLRAIFPNISPLKHYKEKSGKAFHYNEL
jgi:hypothetical protein